MNSKNLLYDKNKHNNFVSVEHQANSFLSNHVYKGNTHKAEMAGGSKDHLENGLSEID